MADPLGRKHQSVRKPKNRHHVDSVCNYILDTEHNDFYSTSGERPSINHVYFDAYAVIHGLEAAMIMLRNAQEEFDKYE